MAGPALADCESEFAFLTASIGVQFDLESGQLVDDGEACRLEDVSFSQYVMRLTVETITWQATGVETLSEPEPEEIDVELTVHNLRFQPVSIDPWLDFMLGEQGRRNVINIAFRAEWDPTSGAFELEELAVALPGENRLRLEYRVEGLSQALISGQVAHMIDMRLEDLELEVVNHGFLDGLMLGFMSDWLRGHGAEPEASVARMKHRLIAAIVEFPDAVFPRRSRYALQDLVAEAPFPWGHLEVRLTGAPVAFDRLVPLLETGDVTVPEGLAVAFEGTVFDIRYDPVPEPR